MIPRLPDSHYLAIDVSNNWLFRPPKVRLTGGEPTIRGDFERILEAGFQGNVVEDKG